MRLYISTAGLFLAMFLILAMASACPQKSSPNTIYGRTLPHGKAIKLADIDIAGTEDKELRDITPKVLKKDGSFVAPGDLTSEEWGKLKTQLSTKVESEPMPFAYYLLAGVNNALGSGSEDAIAAAREAVKLAPESAWANDMLGQVLKLGGRDDEAKLAFDKARTLSAAAKGVPPPYVTSAAGGRDDEVMKGGRDDEVAKGGGRDDEVSDSKLAAELGTGPMRYANYAPAIKLALENPDEPKYSAVKLGLKGADDKELSDIAAKLLTPQGYFYRDAAIADADWKAMMDKLGAKAGAGDNALAAWLYAGAMLVQKDVIESPDLKKVIVQADKAVSLQPDSPRALYMQGVTLALSGASDKAIKVLAKSAKLDQAYVAPHLVLADVYARMGNNDMAKVELDTVAKMPNASKAEKATAEARLKAMAAKDN